MSALLQVVSSLLRASLILLAVLQNSDLSPKMEFCYQKRSILEKLDVWQKSD